jgi:hypothetical protein
MAIIAVNETYNLGGTFISCNTCITRRGVAGADAWNITGSRYNSGAGGNMWRAEPWRINQMPEPEQLPMKSIVSQRLTKEIRWTPEVIHER